MKTLDEISVGRRGTPLLLILSRVAFAALITFAIVTLFSPEIFPYSTLDAVWLAYLFALYVVAEYVYRMLLNKGVDLTFAFPLMFAVFLLNLASVWLDGQTRFPLMNRAEHLTSYVLITYVVWIFFIQYLPQNVWRKHPYYTALLVFAVSTGLGSLNEIFELAMDTIAGTHVVGDKFDTSLDLLMNSLGAGLFLAVRLILGAAEPTLKR